MENRALTPLGEQGRLLVKAANRKPVIHLKNSNIITGSFKRSNQKEGTISDIGGRMGIWCSYSHSINSKSPYSIEERFLNQLLYWIKCNKYGIKRSNRIWIYNTLSEWAEQLNVSISTIRRTIKSLKEQGKIETAYLASNKRNRTLFYTVTDKVIPDEHMDEHMYIEQEQKNNKSIKSGKSLSKKTVTQTTTAQDMLRIWNETLEKKEKMSKELARFLVAAMKFRFKTLEVWRQFVRAIKESAYLMSERFKLFLSWVLKFSSINRIMNGEFGCKKYDYTDEREKEEREIMELYSAIDSIEVLDESDKCKDIRKQILGKTSINKYKAWFSGCRIHDTKGKVFLEVGTSFKRDYITNNFRDIVDAYFDGVVQCQR